MLRIFWFLACNQDYHPSTDDDSVPDGGDERDTNLPPQVPCDLDPPLPSDEFVSPSDGVVLTTSPWIPVRLTFPLEERWTSIRTYVDCKEATDPLAAQRLIPPVLGDGTDFLAYLDLSQLDNGPHVVVARLEDVTGTVFAWQAARFTIERPPNRVSVTVRNASGDEVDARVVVLSNGVPVSFESPDALAVDPQERDDVLDTFLVPRGGTSVWLESGDYDMIAVRGALDTIDHQTIHVDGETDVSFVVDDAFDLEGATTADFHVHTAWSVDSYLPQQVRVQSLLSSGLDLAAVTDHDVIHDLEQEIAFVYGPDAPLLSLSAIEVTLNLLTGEGKPPASEPARVDGHMNPIPLDASKEIPVNTPILGGFLDDLRAHQAEWNATKDGFLELNHPRGMQKEPTAAIDTTADLFNSMGFDPTYGFGEGPNAWMADRRPGSSVRSMDFDSMEIMNRGAWPSYTQVRRDWFALLDWGHWITGVGNSDSHALTTEWVGFPTNIANCPRPADVKMPDDFVECWITAVREGRIRVSTGPIVDLTVTDGGKTFGSGDTITPAGKPELTATVRVRASSWVPVEQIRLVYGGRDVDGGMVVQTYNLLPTDREKDGSLDFQRSWTVPTTEADQWIVAEAGWWIDRSYPDDPAEELGDYALVVPGYLPMGFANPVRVDNDGDKDWGH